VAPSSGRAAEGRAVTARYLSHVLTCLFGGHERGRAEHRSRPRHRRSRSIAEPSTDEPDRRADRLVMGRHGSDGPTRSAAEKGAPKTATSIVGTAEERSSDQEHTCSAAHVKAQVLKRDEPGEASSAEGTAQDLLGECMCAIPVADACKRWLAETEVLMPSVVIVVTDANNVPIKGAQVAIDGLPVRVDDSPIELDPDSGSDSIAVLVRRFPSRERPEASSYDARSRSRVGWRASAALREEPDRVPDDALDRRSRPLPALLERGQRTTHVRLLEPQPAERAKRRRSRGLRGRLLPALERVTRGVQPVARLNLRRPLRLLQLLLLLAFDVLAPERVFCGKPVMTTAECPEV
jgi:hypothetical protein